MKPDPNDNTYGPTCRTFRTDNPDDLVYLVRTGLVWLCGPKGQRSGVRYLVEHPDVSLDPPVTWRLPAQVRAFVTAARAARS